MALVPKPVRSYLPCSQLSLRHGVDTAVELLSVAVIASVAFGPVLPLVILTAPGHLFWISARAHLLIHPVPRTVHVACEVARKRAIKTELFASNVLRSREARAMRLIPRSCGIAARPVMRRNE
jgi:hypothetical protein